MSHLLDFFLHFDVHLLEFVQQYGRWVYGILFVIVFAETGLVVTPFLPGDSLLFAVGALSATGVLNPWLAAGLLMGAAIAGDGVNYSIGRRIGSRLLDKGDGPKFAHRLINPDHVRRAHEFFEKYGGKAVVLARFVPIVRTFLPFVAGAAAMRPAEFLLYNIRERANRKKQLLARDDWDRGRVRAADGGGICEAAGQEQELRIGGLGIAD
jgi:membrane-associated protein